MSVRLGAVRVGGDDMTHGLLGLGQPAELAEAGGELEQDHRPAGCQAGGLCEILSGLGQVSEGLVCGAAGQPSRQQRGIGVDGPRRLGKGVFRAAGGEQGLGEAGAGGGKARVLVEQRAVEGEIVWHQALPVDLARSMACAAARARATGARRSSQIGLGSGGWMPMVAFASNSSTAPSGPSAKSMPA